jgi:hypothetical protein
MEKLQELSRILVMKIELRFNSIEKMSNDAFHKQVVIYEVRRVAITFLTSCTEIGPNVLKVTKLDILESFEQSRNYIVLLIRYGSPKSLWRM